MRAARLLVALLMPPLAGCATFPLLDTVPEPTADQAAYPDLLPLDGLLAQVPPPATDPAAELEARAAALTARAAALREADLSG